MCDADTYATGLLLTQISVGLLTSVLINTAEKSIHQPLPTAQAVPVSQEFDEEEYEEEEVEEYEKEVQDVESGVEPVVPPVERVGQTLRRRNVEQRTKKDSITISVAKNINFDF